MAELRKYATSSIIAFPLIARDTADLISAATTVTAAKTLISKDGGAFVAATNAPSQIGTSGWYILSMTAAELTASRIVVTIIDTASPKVWEDESVYIETYGGGQHAFDLNSANVTAGAITAGALNAAAFNADTAVYEAKVWLIEDNVGANDRYLVAYFKNGQPITTGITVPDIWVYRNDGTDLIGTSAAPIALTQIGLSGTYTLNTATRVVVGAAYIARVRATIDGATRTWYQPVGRDS